MTLGVVRYPGLADSPWATLFCPLRGLDVVGYRMTLGVVRYPGLADSPWATLFCPLRGFVPLRGCGLVRRTRAQSRRLRNFKLEFFVIRKRIHAQVFGHPDV